MTSRREQNTEAFNKPCTQLFDVGISMFQIKGRKGEKRVKMIQRLQDITVIGTPGNTHIVVTAA